MHRYIHRYMWICIRTYIFKMGAHLSMLSGVMEFSPFDRTTIFNLFLFYRFKLVAGDLKVQCVRFSDTWWRESGQKLPNVFFTHVTAISPFDMPQPGLPSHHRTRPYLSPSHCSPELPPPPSQEFTLFISIHFCHFSSVSF